MLQPRRGLELVAEGRLKRPLRFTAQLTGGEVINVADAVDVATGRIDADDVHERAALATQRIEINFIDAVLLLVE